MFTVEHICIFHIFTINEKQKQFYVFLTLLPLLHTKIFLSIDFKTYICTVWWILCTVPLNLSLNLFHHLTACLSSFASVDSYPAVCFFVCTANCSCYFFFKRNCSFYVVIIIIWLQRRFNTASAVSQQYHKSLVVRQLSVPSFNVVSAQILPELFYFYFFWLTELHLIDTLQAGCARWEASVFVFPLCVALNDTDMLFNIFLKILTMYFSCLSVYTNCDRGLP